MPVVEHAESTAKQMRTILVFAVAGVIVGLVLAVLLVVTGTFQHAPK